MELRNEIKFRVRVMTESQMNRSLGIFIGVFLLFFFSGAFIAYMMVDKESVTVLNCYSGSICFELEDGNPVWRGRFDNIVLENQAMALRMIPDSLQKLAFRSNFSLSVIGLDSETATEGHEILAETKDCEIKCNLDNCNKCDLLYLSMIEYSSYIVKLTFLDPIPKLVTSIEFELKFIVRDFTFWQLAFNYTIFCLSVVSLVVYLSHLCIIPLRNWPLESKAIAVLSASLVVSNEPLFALKVYEPSEAIFFFSSFCISQVFIIGLGCCYIFFQENKKLCHKMYYGIILTILFVLKVIIFAESDLQNRYNFYYDEGNLAIFFNNILVYLVFLVLGIIALNLSICTEDNTFISSDPEIQKIIRFSTAIPFLRDLQYLVDPISAYIIYFPLYNFFLFGLAFYCAPKQVSVIDYSELNELGQEIEDNHADKIHPDITETEKEIEDVELIN